MYELRSIWRWLNQPNNKKAVLSQRWPCDAPYIWVLVGVNHNLGEEEVIGGRGWYHLKEHWW